MNEEDGFGFGANFGDLPDHWPLVYFSLSLSPLQKFKLELEGLAEERNGLRLAGGSKA